MMEMLKPTNVALTLTVHITSDRCTCAISMLLPSNMLGCWMQDPMRYRPYAARHRLLSVLCSLFSLINTLTTAPKPAIPRLVRKTPRKAFT